MCVWIVITLLERQVAATIEEGNGDKTLHQLVGISPASHS